MTTVHVLTSVRRLELLYGSELVFATIRRGWPNARIVVTDNASLYGQASLEILAYEAGAEFRRLQRPVKHHNFILDALLGAEGPVVFSDPDIVYWQSCEHMTQGSELFAGRYLPKFFDPVVGMITHERLHTSLLVVPDAARLRLAAVGLPRLVHSYGAVSPCAYLEDGAWYHFDTLAVAYAVFKDDCRSFTEADLDCYDHLFAGTHWDIVAPHASGETLEILERAHSLAKTDPAKLRGIWREQEKIFQAAALSFST